MEGQETDNVDVQVAPETSWRDALVARIRPSDHFVGDDEVFALLTEESEGLTTAERCAARGVTLPMYCVWKRKYQRLTFDQLRAARGRERRRRYMMFGAAFGVMALVVGGITVSAARVVFGSFTAEAEARPGRTSDPIAVSPAPAPAATSRSVDEPRATPVASVKPPAPRRQAAAIDIPAVVETGYRIQVTAADDVDEGRTMVARLTSDGYPAYLTRATVGNSDVFRVRVGPFETLAAAEETASRLRAAGHAGAWITR
jgi:cell division septation protein DedD